MSDSVEKLLAGRIQEVQLFQVDGVTYHSKAAAAKAILDDRLKDGINRVLKEHDAFREAGIYPSQFERVTDKIVGNMALRLALRNVFIQDMELDSVLVARQKEADALTGSGLDLNQVDVVQTEVTTQVKEEVEEEAEADTPSEPVAPNTEGGSVFSPTLDDLDQKEDIPGETRDETSDDIPDAVKPPSSRPNRSRASNRNTSRTKAT